MYITCKCNDIAMFFLHSVMAEKNKGIAKIGFVLGPTASSDGNDKLALNVGE